MIDFELGWRAVPGMLNYNDGFCLQLAAKNVPRGHAFVETGAWCGRSLACICEVLPFGAAVYSFDNYVEDSQAVTDGQPIPAWGAKNLRELVCAHYATRGVMAHTVVGEAAESGRQYQGPPVSALFIDDHHSAEQVGQNLDAWLPHCVEECLLLFHDYSHEPYGIKATCERILPKVHFEHWGQREGSGIGIWRRG